MAGTSRRTWIIVVAAVVVVAIVVGVVLWATSGGVTVPDVTGKTQAEATTALENAGLAVGEVSQASDPSAAAGTVLKQDPAAGAEADEGSTVKLTVSSGPGTVEVPNVTGMQQAEAETTLQSAGFVPKSGQQYDDAIPEGEVMAQLPAGGQQAYKGSEVGLLVSQGQPDTIEVPKVTGMTQDEATATLADVGLEAVAVEAYSPDAAKGSVFDQDPAAGSHVVPLTQVVIVVSLGPGTADVTVPNVVGKPEADAVKALEAAGLKESKAESFSSKVAKGLVMGQLPAAGATMQKGGTVGLLVSVGPPPTPTPTPTPTATSSTSPTPSPEPTASPTPSPPPDIGVSIVDVPDVVGKTGDEATAELTSAGLRPLALKAPSETVPEGTVIAQLPRAGITVPRTFPVLILVSLGPPAQVNPL